MNFLDIIIIIPIIWGAYKGFSKGLISELSTLTALILGIWGAISFSSFIANFLINNFNFSDKYVPIISFALTFILIIIAVHFIAKLLTKLIKAVSLNFLNKITGAAFGILKFGLIISIVIVIINKINSDLKFMSVETTNNSILYKPIEKISTTVFPSLKDFNAKSKIINNI